jgi:hypothetical protein
LGPGVTEINLVAHSLGNLVIRRYLAAGYRGELGLRTDPRVHRIVMLAPPNNGADLTKTFKNFPVMEWIWGDNAVELATNWDELRQHLATPRCQFGIIAGGKGEPNGRNRLIRGDDDFVVGVEETKLAGARDFVVLPLYHSFIMNDAKVHKYVLNFLHHGYFISDAQRTPL